MWTAVLPKSQTSAPPRAHDDGVHGDQRAGRGRGQQRAHHEERRRVRRQMPEGAVQQRHACDAVEARDLPWDQAEGRVQPVSHGPVDGLERPQRADESRQDEEPQEEDARGPGSEHGREASRPSAPGKTDARVGRTPPPRCGTAAAPAGPLTGDAADGCGHAHADRRADRGVGSFGASAGTSQPPPSRAIVVASSLSPSRGPRRRSPPR